MPKGKHIINNKQKRAALVSCTLFAFYRLMFSLCLLGFRIFSRNTAHHPLHWLEGS